METFLAMALGALIGFLWWKAHKLGKGDLVLGIKILFSVSLTEDEENAMIEDAMVRLVERLDGHYGSSWELTVIQHHDSPPDLSIAYPTGAGHYTKLKTFLENHERKD